MPQADLFLDGVPRLTEWAPDRWLVADDWRALVDGFLVSAAGQSLGAFIASRLAQGAVIYPPQPFRALALTPLADVKVLILGQDPYHGQGQAEGLAFSVAPGVKPPPSLRNIFKEIERERSQGTLGAVVSSLTPGSGSLVPWARQGVLLLNTCLTVEEGLPASHAQRGWEVLTDAIVKAVCSRAKPVVFMLWGAQAQAKLTLITAGHEHAAFTQLPHLVLTSNHPSPLSALRSPKPFLGCGHFGQANTFLTQQNAGCVEW